MKAIRYSNALIAAAALAMLAAPALAGAPAKAKKPAEAKKPAKAAKAAETRAGKVVAVRGKVTATKGGASRKLRMKGAIYRGDTINTGKRGRIQVMFTDKTLMNLGPKSTLVVEKYLFGKGKNPEIQTRLKEGVLRVMGGKISKLAPKRFKVKTPTATIGIRGSLWAASFKDGVLLVVQMGGKGVEVSTSAGMVPVTTPQHGTYVRGGDQAPEQPKKVPLAVLMTIIDATVVAGTDAVGVLPPPPPPPDGTTGTSTTDGSEGDDGTAGDQADAFWNPTDDTLAMVDSTVTSGTQATNLSLVTDLPFEGYFLLGLVGPNGGSLADDSIFRGLAEAMNKDGDLRGTAVGGLFGFRAGVPKLQPLGQFSHFERKETSVTWNLKGAPRTLPLDYAHDNLGQFMVFWTDPGDGAYFNDGGLHEVHSLGYVGVPGYGMPNDGILAYGTGNGGLHLTAIRDLESPTPNLETQMANATFFVNYHNDKFVGVLFEDVTGEKCELLFVHGDVDGNKLKNIHYFGVGDRFAATDKRFIYTGGGLHGGIYGGQAQAIGIAGIGNGFFNTSMPTAKGAEWRSAAAAFLDPVASKNFTPRGTQTMNGFMTGISEDFQLSTPDLLRESYNFNPNDFQLTVDYDKGEFSGYASLPSGEHKFSGLQLGGEFGSTVVSRNAMIGMIGGGSVWVGAANGPLDPRGNAMASDFSAPSPEPWASWGLWVVTYEHPSASSPIMVSEGMWVAGKRTPSSEVQALIDASFSATYTGPARIIHFTGDSTYNRFNGGVALNIGFGGGGSVTGSINAGPISMTVGGASQAVNSSGFTSGVTQVNGSGASGVVRGIFCGKNAAGVVGMAKAQQGSDKFHATFIGKR
jgi:hypothetical protein